MDMKEFYESLAGLVRAGWRAKIDDRGWIQLRAPCDQEFSYTPMIAVCLRATKQCFDKSRDRKEVDREAGEMLGFNKGTIKRLHGATFSECISGRLTILQHLGLKRRRSRRRTVRS